MTTIASSPRPVWHYCPGDTHSAEMLRAFVRALDEAIEQGRPSFVVCTCSGGAS